MSPYDKFHKFNFFLEIGYIFDYLINRATFKLSRFRKPAELYEI